MKTNLFIFDSNRCVGCHACAVACFNENGFGLDGAWRTIRQSNPDHLPSLPVFFLSMACNHCENAPCMSHCPANAFSRDDLTGAVLHHGEKCIGCKYCSWVCPYEAPVYKNASGIIEKCHFCYTRLREDLKPACTSLCPTGALNFDKEESTSEELSKSFPLRLLPGSRIKITGLHKPGPPRMDFSLFDEEKLIPSQELPGKSLNLKQEWPLLVFTFIVTLIAALYPSANIIAPASSGWIMTIGLFMAGVTSLFHLGVKKKAWRGLLNPETSWLSREIIFFVFFAFSLVTDLWIMDLPDFIIVFNSLLLLVSADMVYLPVMSPGKMPLHPSQVTLMGLTLWSAMSGKLYFFLFILTVRLFIFVLQTVKTDGRFIKKALPGISWISLLVLSGLVFFMMDARPAAILGLIIAEFWGRINFYNGLRIPGNLLK